MDTVNTLFLCTGNSARSILAEAILNDLGQGRFRGFSAGSQPKDAPHPLALKLLAARGHDIAALHAKRWDVFAGPDAPAMGIILTVCDNAAGETCPVWPGRPATGHWGLPDPAAVTGPQDDQAAAFARTYDALQDRIRALIALPLDRLDAADLRRALARIGAMPGPSA